MRTRLTIAGLWLSCAAQSHAPGLLVVALLLTAGLYAVVAAREARRV